MVHKFHVADYLAEEWDALMVVGQNLIKNFIAFLELY